MGTPELVRGDRGAGPESGGDRTRASGDRVVGRYRLAEQVGDATDPTVWKGFDEVLRRPVAILTFAPGAAEVGEVLAAASAASRVGDVRFAHVFDAADGPEGAYIVTEWPSDACLEDLLADGPLEVAHAVSIVAEAARALSVAHAAGMTHLRLSTRTVRWSTDGGVKITGLAVDAALAGAHSDDGSLSDTRALAALLYASLRSHETEAVPTWRNGIPRRVNRVISRTLLPVSGRGSPPIIHPAQLAAALFDTAHSRTGRSWPVAPRWARLPRLKTAALCGGALALTAAAGLGGFVSGRIPLLNDGDGTSPASSAPRQAATAARPPPATQPPVRRLTPLAIRSFDSNGRGTDGHASQVWHTQWYTTAHFGNLQTGTGLLLDMGRPVRLASVRITLGTVPGADLQVRIAASASSERAFRTVARASGAAGPVSLPATSPLRGRYVLIWFTRLPPADNGSGTYQASIRALTLYGLSD